MPTFIMALLIVAALGLLATSWLSGRRDRDPSSSVNHFHRAMHAMESATPPGPRRSPAEIVDEPTAGPDHADDTVTRR